MSPRLSRGVLDRLDRIEELLSRHDRSLIETTDPVTIRRWRHAVQQMRLELAETKRMLERDGLADPPHTEPVLDTSDDDTQSSARSRGRK